MLGTSSTPYDLRFNLLGIPARVHPLFWLTSALLGGIASEQVHLPLVITWIGCVFVSILVHEYGHALMDKRFHGEPSVLLYGLGGLCYPSGHETPGQKLAVLLAGPGAGFVLFGLVLLATSVVFGVTPAEHVEVVLAQVGLSWHPENLMGAMAKVGSYPVRLVYWNMLWINLWWGLVNLLPIFPLDGGQSAQLIWKRFDRRDGVRRSHILSLVTAGILGVLAFFVNREDLFLPFFFGILALLNYQVLHALHQAHAYGTYEEDEWWRN
ncbi:MAG: site-2 protease family protein [Isosphaeraceae bacterium]